jgi:hypothetical protein
VEGVLGEHDSTRGFHPLPEGLKLLGALRSGYKIILSSLKSSPESVEHWLTLNGINQGQLYETVLLREHVWADQDDAGLRIVHLTDLRARGWGVTLMVDSNPQVIARAVHLGFTGLLWATPTYYRPEFQPGSKQTPRPWQEIEQETERQLELKRTDPRLIEVEDETMIGLS